MAVLWGEFNQQRGISFTRSYDSVVALEKGGERHLAVGGLEEAALVNICREELGSVQDVNTVRYIGRFKQESCRLDRFCQSDDEGFKPALEVLHAFSDKGL